MFILTGVGVVPLAQDAIHTPFHKNGPPVSENCAVVVVLSTKYNLTCERLNWDNQHVLGFKFIMCKQSSTSETFLVGFSSNFCLFYSVEALSQILITINFFVDCSIPLLKNIQCVDSIHNVVWYSTET